MSFSPPKEDNKDLKYNSYKSFIVLTGRFSFFSTCLQNGDRLDDADNTYLYK